MLTKFQTHSNLLTRSNLLLYQSNGLNWCKNKTKYLHVYNAKIEQAIMIGREIKTLSTNRTRTRKKSSLKRNFIKLDFLLSLATDFYLIEIDSRTRPGSSGTHFDPMVGKGLSRRYRSDWEWNSASSRASSRTAAGQMDTAWRQSGLCTRGRRYAHTVWACRACETTSCSPPCRLHTVRLSWSRFVRLIPLQKVNPRSFL